MAVPAEIIQRLGQATTATLSTVMMRDHGLCNTSIRGAHNINANVPRMVGPAYTMRYVPGREDLLPRQWMNHPDNLMRISVDDMPAGVIVVMDSCHQPDVGLLGGNILARMAARNIGGVVTDGGMRDRDEIQQMPMPVYAKDVVVPASFPTLMLAAVQEPVGCGGVVVFPGDIVVGDADGVVVVPAHLAEAMADAAPAMDDIEQWVHRRLLDGAPLDGMYPPNEKAVAQYEAWVQAGRPANRLVVD